MPSRIRLMTLVVSFTLVLLALGALLVVLGIFNAALHWDIFGPRLEALLYGVFGSCMALATFGAAMTVVIALQELVRDFKRFVQARTATPAPPDASRRSYALRMLALVAAMVVLVSLCAAANHVVRGRRCQVFKRLAAEQVANFGPRLAGLVAGFPAPPRDHVPPDVFTVVKTLDDLDFVTRATLYIPDPHEAAALWGYTAWRGSYSNADGFARFYVAKDFEKAVREAMDGVPTALEQINARRDFIWYAPLAGPAGRPNAVLRIDGNPRQSFREYRRLD